MKKQQKNFPQQSGIYSCCSGIFRKNELQSVCSQRYIEMNSANVLCTDHLHADACITWRDNSHLCCSSYFDLARSNTGYVNNIFEPKKCISVVILTKLNISTAINCGWRIKHIGPKHHMSLNTVYHDKRHFRNNPLSLLGQGDLAENVINVMKKNFISIEISYYDKCQRQIFRS